MPFKKGMGALNPLDIINKRFGYLVAIELIPEEKRKNKKKNREWLCQCDCGNKVIVAQRNLTGVKYQQQSCGCLQHKALLARTSKIPITIDYMDIYKDFEKYAFLHRSFVRCNLKNIDVKFYKSFIEKFYYDNQFNILYTNWIDKNKNNVNNTFYNWYKPSIDHIIPKSRGGNDKISNYQFLTTFENLNKRDMTMEEWLEFLRETNTWSDLYINKIIQKEGRIAI
jgi:hypothetical protein